MFAQYREENQQIKLFAQFSKHGMVFAGIPVCCPALPALYKQEASLHTHWSRFTLSTTTLASAWLSFVCRVFFWRIQFVKSVPNILHYLGIFFIIWANIVILVVWLVLVSFNSFQSVLAMWIHYKWYCFCIFLTTIVGSYLVSGKFIGLQMRRCMNSASHVMIKQN